MSAWREALQAMLLWLIARIWVGALVLIALGVLWLQIPDSHIWEFLFSILWAGGLLGLFFWFCTDVSKRLLKPVEEERWWLRWLVVAAVILAGWLLKISIDRLAEHREIYAGYWTSRLPHWLRGLRSYEHLLLLQDWLYCLLRLIVAGLLLPVAVVGGEGKLGGGKRIFTVWLKWWYWAVVMLCGWLAFFANRALLAWTPGRGLSTEVISLFLRLGSVYTLDVILASFVLAVVAVGAQRGERL